MRASRENRNQEYIGRVNSVLDYLEKHYSENLSLDLLAQVANFSPYHFHRVFKGVVGESLYKYIQRIRVEKAAGFLKDQTSRSICDISISCGFSSQSAFARVFKEHFDVSATEWRNSAYTAFSKNRKLVSKNCKMVSNRWKAEKVSSVYIDASTNNLSWEINMLNRNNVSIEVKSLPEINVAYIRHIGEFKGKTERWATLFQKLIMWAGARGLIQCPSTNFYTVFRDDLNITDLSKFKADVCISLAENIKPEGEVGVSTIPAGKYAVASMEIDGDEYDQAWDLIYSEWLPNSGYQPDDRCCYERYLNDPKNHPENKHFIEVCIPIKPL